MNSIELKTIARNDLCQLIEELNPEMAEHFVVTHFMGKMSIALRASYVVQATNEVVRLLNPTLRREPNLKSIAQQIRMVHLFDLNTKLVATGLYETTTVIGDDCVGLIVTNK